MAATVTVACKLPHGLLLQLQRPITIAEPTTTNPDRTVTRYERFGKVIPINGCAIPMDRPSSKELRGGYALTRDVDADFFSKWLEQNKGLSAVEGGFIFASEQPAVIDKYINQGADKRTGMEPADPQNLPAEFRKIETANAGG